MVGENFEIYPSEMAKNAPNHPRWLEKILRFAYLKWLKMHQSSIMVGENFEICPSEMAKNGYKSSTMVGENFEIHLSEMAKNAPNHPPWLEKI